MTKTNPTVSIIVTTKNNERTIKKCLESIKNQTYKNIELIVVDNHSTDNTPNISKKLADKFLTKGPERSAQRNHGAKNSTGEFVLIIDSDMYLTNRVVEACVDKAMEGFKSIIIPEKSIGEGFWSKVKAFERSFYIGNDLIEAPRFFEKATFLQLGGFDEDITGFEDWDLANRTRLNNIEIARIDEFILHDEGKINFMGSTKKKSYYAGWWEKYKNKYPKISRQQINLFNRYPVTKIVTKFLFHPILFTCMIFMKLFEFRSMYKND